MPVAESRCEISDLPVSQCGHCRPAPPRPLRPSLGPWVEARFPSDCDGDCGDEIQEGDMIRSDGEGGWLCQRCGSDDRH